MNKFKALLMAAILLLGLTACSDSGEQSENEDTEIVTETADSAAEETESETETEKPVVERPEDVEVITYTSLTIDEEDTDRFVNGENPTYDAATGCLVFVVTSEIEYDADDACSVGISGEDGAYTVDGTIVLEGYDILESMNGYRGAAIHIDETLDPGNYLFVINFSTYTVSFRYTVQ